MIVIANFPIFGVSVVKYILVFSSSFWGNYRFSFDNDHWDFVWFDGMKIQNDEYSFNWEFAVEHLHNRIMNLDWGIQNSQRIQLYEAFGKLKRKITEKNGQNSYYNLQQYANINVEFEKVGTTTLRMSSRFMWIES